jgi:histidyl-tRNA synthetase
LAVEYSLTAVKPDKQFKRAQELKAAHTVRLERNAAGELAATLKNLKTREEKKLGAQDVAKALLGELL